MAKRMSGLQIQGLEWRGDLQEELLNWRPCRISNQNKRLRQQNIRLYQVDLPRIQARQRKLDEILKRLRLGTTRVFPMWEVERASEPVPINQKGPVL